MWPVLTSAQSKAIRRCQTELVAARLAWLEARIKEARAEGEERELWIRLSQERALAPRRPTTPEQFMRRYPRLTAHIICCSLGYATPRVAAIIGSDAQAGRPNWCEWVYSCYRTDAVKCVRAAIRGRHGHHGYMAEIQKALGLVYGSILHGKEPEFASWF